MKQGREFIIFGFFTVLSGLLTYDGLSISIILTGILLIIGGIFRIKSYPKNFYLAWFSIIALLGLLLLYILLFKAPMHKLNFYKGIGIFIFIIVGFSMAYQYRLKSKMP